MTWDLGYGVEKIEIATQGMLRAGQRDGAKIGFYASTITTTSFLKDHDYDEEPVRQLVKAYLCAHVPVPADW